jgi:hypothetical protein
MNCTIRLRAAIAALALGGFVLPSATFAMSKARTTLTQNEFLECEKVAKQGFPLVRTFDLGESAKPTGKYRFVLPVHFISYNQYFRLPHQEFFRKTNAKEHLQFLRDTFESCGIDIELKRAIRVVGPQFLNTLPPEDPISPPSRRRTLSEKERCLFTPLHADGEVNVSFVDSVGSGHTSNAIMDAILVPMLPSDERFAGAAVIDSQEGGEFADRYAYAVAHEVAHLVTNQGHVNGFAESNILADMAEGFDWTMNASQCEAAQRSRFVQLAR